MSSRQYWCDKGKKARFAALCFSLALSPLMSHADETIPSIIPGIVTVDAEKLIELAGGDDLVIVDSRLPVDHRRGYIEGSISLPDTATDCDSLAAAAPRRASPILFYCNGPKCPRSARAASIAQACGYRKIFWFRGGFDEWKKKKYPYIKQ
ncbi:MAG: rhodanese-like domain-containing protein [Pseudomonadota bacterium]